MIPAYQKLKLAGAPTAEDVSRIQDNVGRTVDPLVGLAILNGNLLRSVTLANGSNTINHGLGRKLIGWLQIRLTGAVTLCDAQSANANPSKTLVIVSTGAATADFWVF